MLRRFMIISTVVTALTVTGFLYEQTIRSAPQMADNVVGSGTPGRIAKWTAADTIGDSVITEDSNGRLGVNGAPNPNTRLFVFNNARAITSSAIVGNHGGLGRGIEGHSVGGIGVNGTGLVGIQNP